jgi:hypothetical protein
MPAGQPGYLSLVGNFHEKDGQDKIRSGPFSQGVRQSHMTLSVPEGLRRWGGGPNAN